MIVIQDIRDFLDGYGVDSSVVPDSYIQSRIDAEIARIEKETNKSFFEIKEITEISTAYGSYTLQLRHFPVTEIIELEIVGGYWHQPSGLSHGLISRMNSRKISPSAYILNYEYGQITFKDLYNWFPEIENSIQIVYKHGYTTAPADAVEGLINLISASCLEKAKTISGDTKSLSIEGWSATYSGNYPFASVVNSMKMTGMDYMSNYYEVML